MDGSSQDSFGRVLDLLCTKLAKDERNLGIAFPYVTKPDGSWDCMLASRSAGYDGEAWSHGNWFCGFWVGLLIAAGSCFRNARCSSLILALGLLVEMSLAAGWCRLGLPVRVRMCRCNRRDRGAEFLSRWLRRSRAPVICARQSDKAYSAAGG